MKINKAKINSGRYKGKAIALPQTPGTRPTKSIVKESAINTLRSDIPFCNFVEVFAGSGSVGIEALSNGAKHAYFLELEKEPAKVLRSNLDSLDISHYDILMGDSFETIKTLQKKLETSNEPTLFYVDPPFHIRENQEDIYEKTALLIQNLPESITEKIVIEHLSSFSFDEQLGPYSLEKKKKFGNTTLSYYQSTSKE
jgi:16S rRNA (guanine(966)-N(2))-methyltransferase RsmD